MYFITKKNITIYFLVAVSLITIGYFLSNEPNTQIQVNKIGLEELITIFSYNSALIFLLLVFSFTGIPIIYMAGFLFSMGESAKLSGIDPSIYYIASLSHGLLEIVLSAIVVFYSISHIRVLLRFLSNRVEINELKLFYKKTLIILFPSTLGVLILAALTEVYISNPIIRILTIGSGY